MRSLSPEEADLWARVTATISPLSREKAPQKPSARATSSETAPTATSKRSATAPLKVANAERRARTADQTLDGSWDGVCGAGAVEPDRVLDLHGMTLDSAWRAIDRGLEEAIARGDRVLLLITGHHRPGEPPVQRGKIRAAVHDWLAASRHAGRIAAVRGAHRRHGGGGSLYIIFRRR